MIRVRLIVPAAFVLCMACVSAAADRQDVKWDRFAGCTLLPNPANDGDSFHVLCDGKERIFRLCFVDCPETSLQVPKRVKEQSEYWHVDEPEVLKTGRSAAGVTSKLLKKPFTVYTNWDDAGGQSAQPRYFAMVEIDGTFLSEMLVQKGYARAYGYLADLPDGESKWVYRRKLQSLEKDARRRRGVWRYETRLSPVGAK